MGLRETLRKFFNSVPDPSIATSFDNHGAHEFVTSIADPNPQKAKYLSDGHGTMNFGKGGPPPV